MGVSHRVAKKWDIYFFFWGGGVEPGRVAYGCLKAVVYPEKEG